MVFHKLLPLVNVVAPPPSVSVTGGVTTRKHEYCDHSLQTLTRKWFFWLSSASQSCGSPDGDDAEAFGPWAGPEARKQPSEGVTVLLLLSTRFCFRYKLLLGAEGEL